MNKIRIECNCKVCKGDAALITADRVEGLTETMIHNYVCAAQNMAPMFAARMGVEAA